VATVETAVMATARETERAPARADGRGSVRRGRPASGPDRLTVGLLTLAGFLVVLSLLASQLRVTAKPAAARHVLVTRRIYQTTVLETVPAPSGAAGGGSSVTQSVSSSGSGGPAYAAGSGPVTRSS
jgi:hypothetical protein